MKIYLDLILSERYWSWSLIGIVYLILLMFVRQLIFRGVVRQTKQIDPNIYSAVKGLYLKKSIPGWTVFSISFLTAVALWIGWKGVHRELWVMALAGCILPILFFVSVILHLLSFAKALLTVLSQRIGVEKEF